MLKIISPSASSCHSESFYLHIKAISPKCCKSFLCQPVYSPPSHSLYIKLYQTHFIQKSILSSWISVNSPHLIILSTSQIVSPKSQELFHPKGSLLHSDTVVVSPHAMSTLLARSKWLRSLLHEAVCILHMCNKFCLVRWWDKNLLHLIDFGLWDQYVIVCRRRKNLAIAEPV